MLMELFLFPLSQFFSELNTITPSPNGKSLTFIGNENDYKRLSNLIKKFDVKTRIESIEIKLKKAGVTILGREGVTQADWVLLDACDVIIHLFKPEVREFYGLERMWAPSNNEETIQVSAD